jgi:hypothetical protein
MSGIDDPRMRKSAPTTHSALGGLGVLANDDAAPPAQPAPQAVQATHICPRCKVDRFKLPCPGPHSACPMFGETSQAAEGRP